MREINILGTITDELTCAGVPPDLWEVLMFRRVEYRTGDGWLLGHSGDTEDKDRGLTCLTMFAYGEP